MDGALVVGPAEQANGNPVLWQQLAGPAFIKLAGGQISLISGNSLYAMISYNFNSHIERLA
jgi:hypothetical protein